MNRGGRVEPVEQSHCRFCRQALWKAGQQGEAQAGKLRAILARNIPAQASVVDQLGIDENWKHNLHAAERAKGGRMLRQAWFECGLGEQLRTVVQGVPGSESTVVSDLCCVYLVAVNRCTAALAMGLFARSLQVDTVDKGRQFGAENLGNASFG